MYMLACLLHHVLQNTQNPAFNKTNNLEINKLKTLHLILQVNTAVMLDVLCVI